MYKNYKKMVIKRRNGSNIDIKAYRSCLVKIDHPFIGFITLFNLIIPNNIEYL